MIFCREQPWRSSSVSVAMQTSPRCRAQLQQTFVGGQGHCQELLSPELARLVKVWATQQATQASNKQQPFRIGKVPKIGFH